MAEKLIGTDIAPPDLVAKITGRARYAEDFRPDGMVFAKMLLSPMPHGRVRGVDVSRAEAMDGVIGILRADEVPQREGPREACLTDEPHYEGEPVLAVAAVTEEIAAAAIEAIDVDFEPLPFVLDPLDSLRPGGPTAYNDGNYFARLPDAEAGDLAVFQDFKWTEADFVEIDAGRMPNAAATREWEKGDWEAAFAGADLIVEDAIVHQSVTHHPMEPRTNMAYWENGKLFAHVSTQSAQRTKAAIAGAVGIDPEDVVLIAEYCGGGFGSKIAGTTVMQIPAIFSRKISRPVMLRITRYEENYVGRARPGFQSWVKMAFRNDGKCVGIDLFKGTTDDVLPVDSLHLGLDAEEVGTPDGLHNVGAVDKHLGGDTASVQAGAAEGPFFDDRHGPTGVGYVRGDLQAGAGTDHDKVKFPHQVLQPNGEWAGAAGVRAGG